MAQAIGEHANKSAPAIQGNLITVANDLKSKRLLGDEDYDRIVITPATPPLQRANDLVQCVYRQVQIYPGQYQVFYSVLEKHPNLQVLLKILPKPNGGGEQLAVSRTGSQQSATLLKREDVGRLRRALRPVAAWWKDLADELNMLANVVPAIERAHGNNHTDCLRAFIETWLNTNPTLETLCKALEELNGDIEEVDTANVASNLK